MEIRQHTKRNILVIDDDAPIGNMLEELLTREGYGVMRAYSGTEAVLLLENAVRSRGLPEKDSLQDKALPPDLILLDLMLPGLSGEKLLSRITGIPVIIVSAKSDIDGKVELLLGGAVDYITKPFEPKELLARIAVQLRKKEEGGGAVYRAGQRGIQGTLGDFAEDILRFDDIVLSVPTRMVTVKEQTVRLTKTEFAILKILMRNPSQVIAKSLLLERISEETPDCMESSLKVHISNLRRKLRLAGGKEYIEAVWGIGFKMRI